MLNQQMNINAAYSTPVFCVYLAGNPCCPSWVIHYHEFCWHKCWNVAWFIDCRWVGADWSHSWTWHWQWVTLRLTVTPTIMMMMIQSWTRIEPYWSLAKRRHSNWDCRSWQQKLSKMTSHTYRVILHSTPNTDSWVWLWVDADRHESRHSTEKSETPQLTLYFWGNPFQQVYRHLTPWVYVADIVLN